MKKKRFVLISNSELKAVVMLNLAAAEIFANEQVIGPRSPIVTFLSVGKLRKNEFKMNNTYSVGWPTEKHCGFGDNLKQTNEYLLKTVANDLKFLNEPFIQLILTDETFRHMLEADMEEICKKFAKKPRKALIVAAEIIMMKMLSCMKKVKSEQINQTNEFPTEEKFAEKNNESMKYEH